MLTPSQQSPELSSYLSGCDAIKLLEVINKTLSCTTKDDFAALYPKIQELFPFDFTTAVLGHHDSNGMVLVPGANISFPEQWLRESLSKNYLQVDAVIIENFTTYRVQHWSAARKELYRREDINSLSQDFGMRECYTYGSRPSAGGQNGSMFCFSSSSMKYEMRTVAILEYLTPHLHLAFAHTYDNKLLETNISVLSSREKEVLNWLKQGKSSWDMSVILGISKRTVDFHVYNVIEKLGATNRTQAVAVATRLGLIDIG
jgi:DNA-binding CsgD family transcriptional regulator